MTKPYYTGDDVELWHGDCLEVSAWEAADVLVTDPPYGMTLRSGWNGAFGDLRVTGDDEPHVRDQVLLRWGDQRPALVFGRWSIPHPAGTRAVLVWEKGDHTGMGDLSLPWKPTTEEIYVLGRGFTGHRSGSVLRVNAPSPSKVGGRNHPTEKPVALLAELIRKCPRGVVADPCAGSGSTLVAAKLLGRPAVGVEIEERYCELIARRLDQGVLPFGEAS